MSTRRRAANRRTTSELTSDAPARITQALVLGILLATVALVIVVRLRLANVPLERDEGEYAYAGQLILQGVPPYELAYNMKFPGTYYAYATVMAIFGQSAWGIRVGLLCVHLLTMGFVFALARRLVGPVGAAIGAAAFAWLALDRWSMGIFAHATHFLVLPAMAGLFVLHRAMRSGRGWEFAAAGFLMGLAIAMKQHALSFAGMAIGLAAWSGRSAPSPDAAAMWRRAAWVMGGLAASFALLLTALASQGVLDRFWFWTFHYGAAYVSGTPASIATTMFGMAWSYITQETGWLWYTAMIGAASLFAARWKREDRIFLAAWLLASALAVMPGFFFRPHYFIVMMPIAGVLVGMAIVALDRALARGMRPGMASAASIAVAVALILAYVVPGREYLFRMSDTELLRSVYQANPFPESPGIARYLNAHTTPDDRIAVFGSEPQIFFYANRKAASGYIYMYPLTERQPYARQMQDEMIREVEAARPKYLVHVGMSSSWAAGLQPDRRMLVWMNDYVAKCYDPVGTVDIDTERGSTVVWDEAVSTYQPRSQSLVVTWRRRATPACDGPG